MDRGFSYLVRKNNLGRHYFFLHMSGWDIGPVLERLLPYLVIKRLHALLLLRVIAIRKALPYHGVLPVEASELLAEISELNVRGFRWKKGHENRARHSILSQKLEVSLQMAS